MCGIFGFIAAPGAELGPDRMRIYLRDLFELSEPRGQEASGLAITLGQKIRLFKRGLRPSVMLQSRGYHEFLATNCNDLILDRNARLLDPVAVMGHCRLVTNGAEIIAGNNHPIDVEGIVGIHNGIVTNEKVLRNKYPNLPHKYEIDSEILLRVLHHHSSKTNNFRTALKRVFAEIEGSASIAFIPVASPIVGLATNLGSLHIVTVPEKRILVFASEAYFLQRFFSRNKRHIGHASAKFCQVKAGEGCLIPFQKP